MKLYSIPEIKKILNIKRAAMDAIIARGEIGTVTVGKRRRVSQKQLDDYLENAMNGGESNLVADVNTELESMGAEQLTGREEILIGALKRVLRNNKNCKEKL